MYRLAIAAAFKGLPATFHTECVRTPVKLRDFCNIAIRLDPSWLASEGETLDSGMDRIIDAIVRVSSKSSCHTTIYLYNYEKFGMSVDSWEECYYLECDDDDDDRLHAQEYHFTRITIMKRIIGQV